MLDENDIQKLLRLKRFEQPPAGYHQTFLHEFHRRQRAEMLRQPLWKIAFERLGAFFSDGMGRLAYGAATAAVLLFAGVASYDMIANSNSAAPASQGGQIAVVDNGTAGNGGNASSRVADNNIQLPPPVAELSMHGPVDVSLSPSNSLPALSTMPASDTHYILGTHPASYDRPFSF